MDRPSAASAWGRDDASRGRRIRCLSAVHPVLGSCGDGVHGSSASDARQVCGICRMVTPATCARHGVCFGIVPDGMTAAVGILQIRLQPTLSDAEWGFVLSTHFWSTGVFSDAANVLMEFAFTTMQFTRLEARIALRNRRAHAA